jgi:hypothetical protein
MVIFHSFIFKQRFRFIDTSTELFFGGGDRIIYAAKGFLLVQKRGTTREVINRLTERYNIYIIRI